MTPIDRILFLGDNNSLLIQWLKENGYSVFHTSEKIDSNYVLNNRAEFIVSYGYRHIIPISVLELFPRKAINLHISYLPWNRGADPNFWSFLENSPKGVTIHYLDSGLDTGDIIVQKELTGDFSKETLRSFYLRLQKEIVQLFQQNWSDIVCGGLAGYRQIGSGSYHKSQDKERFLWLLDSGWDTPVSKLIEYQGDGI